MTNVNRDTELWLLTYGISPSKVTVKSGENHINFCERTTFSHLLREMINFDGCLSSIIFTLNPLITQEILHIHSKKYKDTYETKKNLW